MIDQVIIRWRMSRPEVGKKPVALVLHTSCLNYEISSIRRLREEGFLLLLPDNVYWELRMMTRSRTKYAGRARYLLEGSNGAQRCPWDLEDLYQPDTIPDIFRRSRNIVLFLFGDMNKMDEFLANVQPLDSSYILVSHDWTWNGPKTVCTLNRICGGAFRKSIALSPSVAVPGLADMHTVLCWDRDGAHRTSGCDYQRTNLCGSNSFLYTHPEYPGCFFKIYREKAYDSTTAQKIFQMQTYAHQFSSPHTALPRLILTTPNGEVIGYSMEDFRSVPLRVYITNGWLDKTAWDMGQILSELFLLMLELHTRHILINDLSYNNILVDNDNHVYLVDCDSFQFYDYAGGAMTEIYRHQQIDPAKSGSELHMPMHEYFALAVLLFQCFHGGDPLSESYPDWSCQNFALEEESCSCESVNECILENWRALEPEHRKMFVDTFRFRSVQSIGAWIRALGLLE